MFGMPKSSRLSPVLHRLHNDGITVDIDKDHDVLISAT